MAFNIYCLATEKHFCYWAHSYVLCKNCRNPPQFLLCFYHFLFCLCVVALTSLPSLCVCASSAPHVVVSLCVNSDENAIDDSRAHCPNRSPIRFSFAHSHRFFYILRVKYGMVNNFCGYSVFFFSLSVYYSCSFISYLMSNTFRGNRWKSLHIFRIFDISTATTVVVMPRASEIFNGFWNDTTSYFVFMPQRGDDKAKQTMNSNNSLDCVVSFVHSFGLFF